MAEEKPKEGKKEKRASLYDHPSSGKHREEGKGGKLPEKKKKKTRREVLYDHGKSKSG